MSTIPAIFIKIYLANREIDNTGEVSSPSVVDDKVLPIQQFVRRNPFDLVLNKHLRSLPSPQRLRITAYVILIVVILSTCFVIYLFSFLAMGFWLKYYYHPNDLMQGNTTVNPFYAALVISITGFNQNGLSVW